MGLLTRVSSAKKGTKSLKTTIPEGVAEFLELSNKDGLEWIMQVENNMRSATIRKKAINAVIRKDHSMVNSLPRSISRYEPSDGQLSNETFKEECFGKMRGIAGEMETINRLFAKSSEEDPLFIHSQNPGLRYLSDATRTKLTEIKRVLSYCCNESLSRQKVDDLINNCAVMGDSLSLDDILEYYKIQAKEMRGVC
jgi:hypothetical protein